MKRIVISGVGVILFLGLFALSAAAQAPTSSNDSSAGSSLGDYARQVRKTPTTQQPQQKKVFDNDNLPTNDKLSIVGPPPAAPSDGTKADSSTSSTSASGTSSDAKTDAAKPGDAKAGDAKPSDSKTPADKDAKQQAIKQWTDKLSSQKDQIDLLGRELDVLQKEYQLRAAAMYGDAGNRMRNQSDWDKQDADYKQQIADKQKALDDAKSKMDDMQEDARKAGVPESARDAASTTQPAPAQ